MPKLQRHNPYVQAVPIPYRAETKSQTNQTQKKSVISFHAADVLAMGEIR